MGDRWGVLASVGRSALRLGSLGACTNGALARTAGAHLATPGAADHSGRCTAQRTWRSFRHAVWEPNGDGCPPSGRKQAVLPQLVSRCLSTDSRSPPLEGPTRRSSRRTSWIEVDVAEIEKRMSDKQPSTNSLNEQPAKAEKEPETPLTRQIKASIKFRGGPITVAEYMKEVLTNPLGGFYAATGGEAIGKHGHFITSPDISTLFGEMLGIWVYNTYQAMGSPAKFKLVELGPGRGTLMRQMLTAVKSLPDHQRFVSALDLHLVEISPDLRNLQYDALSCHSRATHEDVAKAAAMDRKAAAAASAQAAERSEPRTVPGNLLRHVPPGGTVVRPKAAPVDTASHFSSDLAKAASGTSRLDFALARRFDAVAEAKSDLAGCTVTWHYTFDEVEGDAPMIVVGNEYLDALPIHQFVKDEERGWLEVLVAELNDPTSSQHLDFVLSPAQTIAVRNVLRRRLEALPEREKIRGIEVSPQAMALAETVALRIGASGGAALFIDYGQDGPYANSLNAIRNHAPVHVLQEPGTADVTAWVDFSALRQAVEGSSADVRVHGPMTQGRFLLSMGIEQRVDMLLQERRTPEECNSLEDNFARLVASTEFHPQGMGETFKVLALTPSWSPTPYPFDVPL